jgi:VanZ family protein
MLIGKFFDILFHQKHSSKWQVIFWLNASLLLYLTLMPSVHHQLSYQNIDKVFHFIGFGAFAFSCVLAFPRLHILWAVTISCLLGVAVEVIQAFLPHRGFSYADMMADFVGIIAAVTFLWIGRKASLRLEQGMGSRFPLERGKAKDR